METLDHRQIQLAQLEVLHDVDRFCRETGIRYSLSYGTLIGAVRHQGFIPWDDDIDLMMPRPDFDRFVANYKDRGPFRCLYDSRERDHHFVTCYAKVEDTRTVCLEQSRLGVYEFGINLDIFPIDAAPADPAQHEGFMRMVRRLKHRIFFCQKPFFPISFHVPLIPMIEAQQHSLDYWMERCTRYMTQYNGTDTPYAGTISGTTGVVEIYRKEIFDDYVDLPFEDGFFRSIAAYDIFLRQQFGDYMQLPPEKDRVNHSLKAWRK